MAFSYWESTEWLEGHDLIVIGGGIVGLSAALQAKKMRPKWKVAVVERDPFGGGGSTKNAGFACFGSTQELMHDRMQIGDKSALDLLKKRIDGLKLLRMTLGDASIGYRPCGSLEIVRKHSTFHAPTSAYLKGINEWAASATGTAETFQSATADHLVGIAEDAIEGAVFSPLEGAIDTGKMMRSMRQRVQEAGVDLLFGLEVIATEADLAGHRIHIKRSGPSGAEDSRWIQVPHLIIATNAFAQDLLPECDVKPQKNRVLVTEPIKNLQFDKTVHMDAGYLYVRNIADRMLIGGGRHWKLRNNEVLEKALLEVLHTLWPQTKNASLDSKWTGVLGIGLSREPIVARVQSGCVAAVKMGGMGVAIGMQIGQDSVALLLSD